MCLFPIPISLPAETGAIFISLSPHHPAGSRKSLSPEETRFLQTKEQQPGRLRLTLRKSGRTVPGLKSHS